MSAARCGASGKLINDADGLIWPTEGRIFGLAGRRYATLVVNQTTACGVPSQQTRKFGQMVQSGRNLLYMQGAPHGHSGG
jgi:hypothetical protein